MTRPRAVLALDQGTTSTRALVVDEAGRVVADARREHAQHFPQPGWVEHDALEIWADVQEVLGDAAAAADAHELVALGITNQRETLVVWNPRTGVPVQRAIVWQDVRADADVDELAADGDRERLREITGLPMDAYFTGFKLRWMLRSIPGLREAAERGDVLAGTIDSWLIWNLTGGVDGGRHATDVTNASRTALMDLEQLDWSPAALELLGIPRSVLPTIVPSSGHLGTVRGVRGVEGAPVAGVLGDQQAAAFGQAVFHAGASKSTFGTGSFLLASTGTERVRSRNGLISTVGYQLAGRPASYALEGSVSVAGSLIHWLRDGLGIIRTSAEIEELAREVADAGGVVIVPAFQGLLAPHWRPDARGAILGLTRYADRRHLARAALEAVAWQTCDLVAAVESDLGAPLRELRVDGGMARNDLFLQIQADVLGRPVVRPAEVETTALGAAFVAGLATGVWSDLDAIATLWAADRRWAPQLDAAERAAAADRWQRAVSRSLDWAPAPSR